MIGERINNIGKVFNIIHAGLTRKDDYPPQRLMEEPIKSGPYKGELLSRKEWDNMLDKYYSLNGWEICTGIPTANKLTELGMEKYIKDIKNIKNFLKK
jgi:aldehyde:ferredoxin oxidoreductase